MPAAFKAVKARSPLYLQCKCLVLIHRAENTDNYERFSNIIQALDEIAGNTPVILPLHPRAKKKLDTYGMTIHNITCIEPVGYFDMLTLLSNTKAVFTDSGGLQKEAYFFKKSCITLRDETEWVELVENGFNVLVGSDVEMITGAERDLHLAKELRDTELYGDGQAGDKIVRALIDKYLSICISENRSVADENLDS